MLSHVLRAAYTKPGLDPALVEDVCVGTTLQAGGGAGPSRMASLHAGIPYTASLSTVNRQCSSGLTSINQIANQIRSGQIDIGIGKRIHLSSVCLTLLMASNDIGAGVESMTMGYAPSGMSNSISEEVLSHPLAEECLLPMGITSENVASDFGVSRKSQDAFAASSFQKAAAAQKAGKFRGEILAVKAKVTVKGKDGSETVQEVLVDADDGVRDGVTAESLGKLKPAFTKDGSTHAGKFCPSFPSIDPNLTCSFRERLPSIRWCCCCPPRPPLCGPTSQPPHHR